MKKKLSISELKVQSFVTRANGSVSATAKIEGGLRPLDPVIVVPGSFQGDCNLENSMGTICYYCPPSYGTGCFNCPPNPLD